MQIYTREQLLDKYKTLPDTLQEAIMGIESVETIQKVGRDHNLHVDQLGALGSEVGLVLLGFTRPYEFMSHIAERLKVTPEEASKIADEVDRGIFSKVYEEIRALHQPKTATEAEVKAESDDKYREPVILDRNNILNEIENPAKVIVSTVKSEPTETSTVKATPEALSTESTKSIFNEKMVQLFNVPKATTIVDNRSKEATPIVHERTVDPYRESVN